MRTSSGARPSAELRRRLLEAMGEVVGERGYAKTSVADVIRTAGAARSSFYKLFEDKQNAYLAAFDMVVERVEDEMRTAAGRTPGDGELTPEQWSADLRARLDAVIELFTVKPWMASMSLVEVAVAGPEALRRYREALGRFAACLGRGREVIDAGDTLPPHLDTMALGGAISLLTEELRSTKNPDLPALSGDVYFALLMPYLGASRAAELTDREYGPAAGAPRGRD